MQFANPVTFEDFKSSCDDLSFDLSFDEIFFYDGMRFYMKDVKYEMGDFLGDGVSSNVYSIKMLTIEGEIKGAIKVFSKHSKMQRELTALRSFSENDYFVQVYDSFTYKGHDCIVMQKMDGNLLDLIRGNDLNASQIKSIITQLLRAGQFLEKKGMCHRDIKPENIGYIKNGNSYDVKLMDFGLCKYFGETITSGGTISYTHKILFSETRMVTNEIDKWSLGCVFHELVTGNVLFELSSSNSSVENYEIIESTSLRSNCKIFNKIEFTKFIKMCLKGVSYDYLLSCVRMFN